MKVVQLLPTIAFGDAIGNDTIAIKKILWEEGYDTEIYADIIDSRLPKGTAKSAELLSGLAADDVLIYHASTGTALNEKLPQYGGRQIMVYHNITPPSYFHEYNAQAEFNCEYGYRGMRFLADKISCCIADSEYNRQDLLKMGFTCPIDVCPILIPFDDYKKAPDTGVLRKYRSGGWQNLLFVGRIAPNKKHEDLIRAFYVYQRYYQPRSRLFLVGTAGGMEKYERQLKAYISSLGLQDKIIFPGHIKFREVLAYYYLADLFLCMSEHEGFCVPLVEAMYFQKPVVARSTTAVPETLGNGGLLLPDQDPKVAAAAIHRVLTDKSLNAYLRKKQQERLAEYKYEKVKMQLLQIVHRVIGS